MTDNKWLRNSFVWVIIMVAMLVLFFTFVSQRGPSNQKSLSDVIDDAKSGKITKIIAHEDSNDITVIEGTGSSETQYTALKESQNSIYDTVTKAGEPADKLPPLTVEKASNWGGYVSILGFLLPTLILVAVFVFMMRQAQGTNNLA